MAVRKEDHMVEATRRSVMKQPRNQMAYYSCSSPTGLYRDSRGYAMLREEAYQKQMQHKTNPPIR